MPDESAETPPFVPSSDLPGPEEFPDGPVGDQLRVENVVRRRREELLEEHKREGSPGDLMRKIEKANPQKNSS